MYSGNCIYFVCHGSGSRWKPRSSKFHLLFYVNKEGLVLLKLLGIVLSLINVREISFGLFLTTHSGPHPRIDLNGLPL